MKKTHKFIENIIETCKIAKAQSETGGSDKAIKLDHLFQGLTPEGKVAAQESLDASMQRLAIINHLLTEEEIKVIMTSSMGSIPEKEHLLMQMHLQRASDVATEQNARVHAAKDGIILV